VDSLSDWISRRADVWQGRHANNTPGIFSNESVSTGYPELDDALPGSGWPERSLVELQMPTCGCGEMRLLLPLLRQICAREQQVAWIDPPHIPYPQALQRQGLDVDQMLCVYPRGSKDILWSMEKLLRCNTVGAVLSWQSVSFAEGRRLKLAAVEGNSIGFLLRLGRKAPVDALPISLRLRLTPRYDGISIDLFKVQGSCGTSVQLNWSNLG
jgi:hypothetical protein